MFVNHATTSPATGGVDSLMESSPLSGRVTNWEKILILSNATIITAQIVCALFLRLNFLVGCLALCGTAFIVITTCLGGLGNNRVQQVLEALKSLKEKHQAELERLKKEHTAALKTKEGTQLKTVLDLLQEVKTLCEQPADVNQSVASIPPDQLAELTAALESLQNESSGTITSLREQLEQTKESSRQQEAIYTEAASSHAEVIAQLQAKRDAAEESAQSSEREVQAAKEELAKQGALVLQLRDRLAQVEKERDALKEKHDPPPEHQIDWRAFAENLPPGTPQKVRNVLARKGDELVQAHQIGSLDDSVRALEFDNDGTDGEDVEALQARVRSYIELLEPFRQVLADIETKRNALAAIENGHLSDPDGVE